MCCRHPSLQLAGFCGKMLQKPLTVVEPPHTWSDTQWRDMQTADFTAQNGSLNNCSNDQSAAALKLAGGTAPKPKYKLTGIKIGGKQVALPKAGKTCCSNFSGILLYAHRLASICHFANLG